MEAKIISLPKFNVVGYKIEANLNEFDEGIGKSTYRRSNCRSNGRLGD